MTIKFTNNAEAALSAGITAAATTLDVKTGQGDMFPEITGGSGDYFMFALVDVSGNIEVCKCTQHAAGSVTFDVIVREQEDVAGVAAASTGQSFSADDKVELRQTAGILNAWEPEINKAHTQNTDVSTTSDVFQLESGSSGVKLKNDSGVFAVRNAADDAWAALKATVGTFTGQISGASIAITGDVGAATGTFTGLVTGITPVSSADFATKGYVDTNFAPMASGTKMYFYENTAPSGWVIDSGPADSLLSVKGGAQDYNISGGQTGGSWTPTTHIHTMGTHKHTMGSHSHTGPSHTHTMPTHTHTMNTHSHTMGTHVHQWYDYISGSDDKTYNSGGASLAFTNADNGGSHIDLISSSNGIQNDSYTSAVDPGNTNATDPGDTNATDPGNTNAGGTGSTGSTDPGDTQTVDPGDTNAGSSPSTDRPKAAVGLIATKS